MKVRPPKKVRHRRPATGREVDATNSNIRDPYATAKGHSLTGREFCHNKIEVHFKEYISGNKRQLKTLRYHPHRRSGRQKCLTWTFFGLLVFAMSMTVAIGRRTSHKRLIIHVPFQIKTHHHTHTVYSHVHSKASSHPSAAKQTIYKILGYAAHGKSYNHGHGGGHHSIHRGHDMYEDVHGSSDGCEHGPSGDMVFNHFSRKDGEYPFEDEYIDDDDDSDIDEEVDEEEARGDNDAWLQRY